MPKPKRVLNGFTAQQVRQVTGLSVHMINYLAREGYLVPTYAEHQVRGKVRYYSYRDLVVARIVQRLRDVGIELKRLKRGIQLLSSDSTWLKAGRVRSVSLLGTDGKRLFFPDENGSLIELTREGQRSFAFVLDVARAQSEVKRHLSQRQIELFELRNQPLQIDERASTSSQTSAIGRATSSRRH
jgi:DNA-binding transcriptional MerR regulator